MKSRYLVLAVCIAVGVTVAAPSWYFHFFEPSYRGIELFGSDAEDAYVALIQEVYDGHPLLGNAYWAREKDQPYILQPLSPMLVAGLGKVLFLSAVEVNLLTKFLLPFLLALLVYLLFKDITGRTGTALSMMLFVLLIQATWVWLNPGSWDDILFSQRLPGVDDNFLSYARPINPQVSSFFFFGYLLCLWRALFTETALERAKRYAIAAAVILGLSFYTYFFTFSFLFAFNAALLLWYLWKRERQSARTLFFITGGALLIGIPYFFNLYEIMRSPFSGYVATVNGSVEGRHFILSKVWWGFALVLALAWKHIGRIKVFALAFLAASFLMTNQQLITNVSLPVPAHYNWYYIAPVCGALLIYFAVLFFEKRSRAPFVQAFLLLVGAVFFYTAFLVQQQSYKTHQPYFVGIQRYADVLAFADTALPKESVVLANENLSNLLATYTSHNVHYSTKVVNFLVDPARVRASYYLYLALQGLDAEHAESYFGEHRNDIGSTLYGMRYREQNGCGGCFPENVFQKLVFEYKEFMKGDWLRRELKKYGVQYVLWDKTADGVWQLDRFFTKELYAEDGLIIYDVAADL